MPSPDPVTADSSTKETAKIVAAQNDAFRKASLGLAVDGAIPSGQVVMTQGIVQQTDAFKHTLFAAIAAYDTFNEESDPYGWHEMGVIEIAGETVWFKLDLYDSDYHYGSPDPTNLEVTRRVMTILLPSEY